MKMYSSGVRISSVICFKISLIQSRIILKSRDCEYIVRIENGISSPHVTYKALCQWFDWNHQGAFKADSARGRDGGPREVGRGGSTKHEHTL